MFFTLFPTKALYVCLLLFCLFFSLFDSSCCRFVAVSGFLCKEQVGMVSWAFKMAVCYWHGVRYTIVTQISLALCFRLLGGSLYIKWCWLIVTNCKTKSGKYWNAFRTHNCFYKLRNSHSLLLLFLSNSSMLVQRVETCCFKLSDGARGVWRDLQQKTK